MPSRHVFVIGVALSLGACAAAVPGYEPPNPKLDRIRAAAPKGGGFTEAGVYNLTDQERELDCKRLTGSISIKIVQIRNAGNRPEPSLAASGAQAAARPLIGGTTYGQDIGEDLKRDRARLEALNEQLAAKKCPTFDLDADLKPGNTATPRPLKPQKKS